MVLMNWQTYLHYAMTRRGLQLQTREDVNQSKEIPCQQWCHTLHTLFSHYGGAKPQNTDSNSY